VDVTPGLQGVDVTGSTSFEKFKGLKAITSNQLHESENNEMTQNFWLGNVNGNCF
jgi:hypothetical protein